MIKAYKKVGETPLQMLDRIRVEKPELKNEKLSYAGRLDPMAEGETVILVGNENNDRDKYMKSDKEYVATFLCGVSTDTGDVLGLLQDQKSEVRIQELEEKIESFKNIKIQTYPWFSGMTVDGKKLFDHYKEGNTKIQRPVLDMEIKDLEFLGIRNQKSEKIKKYIFESIGKVEGDFRQEEILRNWKEFFEISPVEFTIFEVKFLVSSGTFIRALTEEFDFPVCLLKLERTRVLV